MSLPREGTRDNTTPAARNGTPRLTVADLAKAKKLPAEFLRDKFGLRDGVEIPYHDAAGNEIVVKRRTALKATEGSYWPKGAALLAYGQERLGAARKARLLMLVEGESDCWACWYHGVPALGIPGANAVKVLTAEHFNGIETIYIHREPDRGGQQFAEGIKARLETLGFRGKVFELRLADGVKDAADLHAADPETFLDCLRGAIEAATPIPLQTAGTGSNGQLHAPEAHGDPPTDADLGTLLSTVQAERVRWLWPGRIPLGKLTILDGDPGLGKSVLTLDLAARVTRGLPMPFEDREPGVEPEPAGVVLLSAEDGLADTIRPRLDAAGADLQRVLALDKIPERGGSGRLPVLPQDVLYIRQACRRMAAKLITIDPITAFLGSDTNTHKDQDVRRALHPLSVLAEQTGAAVVVVRHLNKAAGGNPLYRGGGSIGIIGAARSGLLVARDPDNEDRRVLASTKCNLAKLPASLAFDLSAAENGALRIVWIGPSAHTAQSLLALPQNDEDRGAVEDAVQALREILGNGPATAELAKKEARKAGIADVTLRRAKALLGVKSSKSAFGAGWQWSLPAHAP